MPPLCAGVAEKDALRAEFSALERSLTAEERQRSDARLSERFLALPRLAAADRVMLYHSVGREISTRALLEQLQAMGKQVLLPRCLPEHAMEVRLYRPEGMIPGVFGILEPGETCPLIAPEEIDLILVPALCYDRDCRRMGRGGGYYDRFLPRCTAFTVGLCRDVLLCHRLPTDPWDRGVDFVLTETQCFP